MKSDKSDKSILWIFGGLAVLLCLMFFVMDLPLGFLTGGASKPMPGKVYELTAENLSAARRVPVLVALFTTHDNMDGTRMARTLPSLAERVKDTAIVAHGNMDSEPDLAAKANVRELPAWIIYRDGREVTRATGKYADVSLDRLIQEQTGKAP
jgi:thioredoxin-like negative regulator of GroEL